MSLHRAHPEAAPATSGQGASRGDLLGDRVRLHVDGMVPLVAEVTDVAVAQLDLHDGVDLWVSVKATETSTYPV